MERLKERLQVANQALSRLEEALSIESPSLMERDATIQRFEFTFEALWNVAKEFLYTIEGIDVASPKGVVRSSREISILDDKEATQALVMVDDRNLTVHTYNETLAMEIYNRIKPHAALMRAWLNELHRRTNNN